MKILGIQKNHNNSVALFENGNLVYYNQEERLSKIKKQSTFPFLCVKEIKKKFDSVDKVLITGHENSGIDFIGQYLKNEINLITDIENQTFFFYNSHHLIHAAKSFFDSTFNEAIVFVIDGRGSTYNLSNGEIGYETTSVYEVDDLKNFNCIYKKIYTNSEVNKNLKINYSLEQNIFHKIKTFSLNNNTKFDISNSNDLGHLYAKSSANYNWQDEEGKLMGLSAYGKYNKKLFDIVNFNDLFFMKHGEEGSGDFFNFTKYPEIEYKNKDNFNNLLDLSFAIQSKFENDYLDLVTSFLKKSKHTNIILTGGTSLNVVNNYKIKKQLDTKYNLFIDPLCGDEGNSIGICKYFLNLYHPEIKLNELKNLYLGPDYEFIFKLNKNEVLIKEVSIEKIVQLLVEGNVIALYQNKAEAGPRALGNRSLLLDPRIKNGKEIMNLIKRREEFRPFACSILEEEANNWFDMANLKTSPYMLYAVQALKGVKEKINSVIHLDNTCRVQTISNDQNKTLYDILKKFNEETNVPILMNTSFNLAKKPLVETPEDAINTLRESKIEYLYFADIKQLIYIKNE
jgi:carbamoyltransferase